MTHNPSRIGGTAFKDSKGNAGLYPVLKAAGINAIRLRVWVRPEDPNGWSGKEDVVRMAKRAAEAGMAVMIDFTIVISSLIRAVRILLPSGPV